MMRKVLIVVKDETLVNRMRIIFKNKDYEFFYAQEGSAAFAVADEHEIAVAVIDFNMPVLSGREICETLAAGNSRMQFIFLFEAKDTDAVLRFYNKYHIAKLVCMEEFDISTISEYIDDCMHTYYQREEILKLKDKVDEVSEKYLKPMTDMSNLLNERLRGYEYIIKVFMSCMDLEFLLDNTDNKTLDVFVDRVINDFVQLYLINEPDAEGFFNGLNDFYNKPDDKKYFKFVSGIEDINAYDNRYNIIFTLNVITICFDTFFHMYRGKIELTESDDECTINSIYEIRYNPDGGKSAAEKALSICNNVLENYCDTIQYARKDELIQFKAVYKRNLQNAGIRD